MNNIHNKIPEIDPLYLTRNLASAIANISKSFNNEVGLNFDFYHSPVSEDGVITFKQKLYFENSINIFKSDFEKCLIDRNFLTFTDDSGASFIGHTNLLNSDSCFKFKITFPHMLLSIPDKKLSKYLMEMLNE